MEGFHLTSPQVDWMRPAWVRSVTWNFDPLWEVVGMTTVQIIGVSLLGVVTLFVLVGIVSKLFLNQLKATVERRIAAVYAPGQILLKDLTANSFGLESAGVWQIRGNGALVLTRDCLHFFMFLPSRDFRVPLDAVTGVTFTKHHLAKATIFDLLKVVFSADGKQDSIAWYLSDPAAWKHRIEELRSGKPRIPSH